jgi:uncharacterized protein YqiB (DUF1249 family)
MILLPAVNHAWLHNPPGTFSALMDLYERNYIQMRRLLPEIPPAAAGQVSRIPGGLDLHLQVVERQRYTSELILTYRFGQDRGPPIAEPDLRIRIYHDARLAEVMTAHLRHHAVFHADLADAGWAARAGLYRRWRINRFLYKWLGYCLRQGHCFTGGPP